MNTDFAIVKVIPVIGFSVLMRVLVAGVRGSMSDSLEGAIEPDPPERPLNLTIPLRVQKHQFSSSQFCFTTSIETPTAYDDPNPRLLNFSSLLAHKHFSAMAPILQPTPRLQAHRRDEQEKSRRPQGHHQQSQAHARQACSHHRKGL
jgi:hypothetical protein